MRLLFPPSGVGVENADAALRAASGSSAGAHALPRLLPAAVIGDGDADAAIADLRDHRPFTGLDQALGRPNAEPVYLGPLRDGHHALIVQRAVAFASRMLFCFA